jgi:hypothetical protein
MPDVERTARPRASLDARRAKEIYNGLTSAGLPGVLEDPHHYGADRRCYWPGNWRGDDSDPMTAGDDHHGVRYCVQDRH